MGFTSLKQIMAQCAGCINETRLCAFINTHLISPTDSTNLGATKPQLETYCLDLALAFALLAVRFFGSFSLPATEGAVVDAFTLLRPVLWYPKWRSRVGRLKWNQLCWEVKCIYSTSRPKYLDRTSNEFNATSILVMATKFVWISSRFFLWSICQRLNQ